MILITYGTRPEYLKVKPLIDEMISQGIEFYTLFTGQHKDIAPDNADFSLEMNYVISENRLDSVIGNILKYGDEIYNDPNKKFEYVLVQGDTTSVLSIALSAFHHGKKVIHLEAGLRTYDKRNPYPEETNRRIVSSIADIHLCPTELSKQNLINEKTEGDIYVVGNTILDSLVDWLPKCEYGDTVLVTMHRRENHYWMDWWFSVINDLAITYPQFKFIIPLHPNPNVQKHKHLLTHVEVLEPLSHEDLLDILVKCRLVITDSGGIQEECSFFNKKCLTCRKFTERPEAVGKTTFMVENPTDLSYIFEQHIKNYVINESSPFGDGFSSKKIVNIFETLFL